MSCLYVSDLDGTLLRTNATLSPYALATLNDLLDSGLAFTVASARSVVSMGEVLAGLNLRLPVIEFNGAFITDIFTGQHLVINSLRAHLIQSLHECILNHHCVPIVSTFNGECDCLYYDTGRIANAGIERYIASRTTARDRRLRPVSNLEATFADRVVCLTMINRRPALEPLRASLLERHGDMIETHMFEDAYNRRFWLTAHDRQATKDQAIATLADSFGFAKDSIIVFGDQSNDIRMFQAASRSVAVSNAIPELKAIANEVIGSNDEDSVVKLLVREFQESPLRRCSG